MKIHHKLLAAFSAIALLAVLVGFFSLNASRQIVDSFEWGEQYFRANIQAANELNSVTKRAESHLLLYLAMHDQADRNKYLNRHGDAINQLNILERNLRMEEARELLPRLSNSVKQFFSVGDQIIRDFDEEFAATGIFDATKHEQLVVRFSALSSIVVVSSAELANLQTDFLNKQLVITAASEVSRQGKELEGDLMLHLLLDKPKELQKYLVGRESLDKTLQVLEERLRDESALALFEKITTEVRLQEESGDKLIDAMEQKQRENEKYVIAEQAPEIKSFHDHSAAIRVLGMELASLMSDLEYSKKAAAIQTSSSIQRSIFILVLTGGFASLILAFFLARTIARPIEQLKDAAQEIGRGNLNAEVDLAVGGEIEALANSFNTMARDLRATRSALLAEKEYTDNILGSMSDALFVVSTTGKYQTINKTACALFGFESTELVGQPFQSLFVDVAPFTIDGSQDLAQTAEIQQVETLMRAKDGRRIPVFFSSSLMFDADHSIVGIVCLVQDITERKEAMEELARMATVVEQAAEAIVITDLNGRQLYVNPAFVETTGFSVEDAVGAPVDLFKNGKHDDRFYLEVWEYLKRGETWRGHLVNRRKDGSLYDEECTISPVRDEQGTVINYVFLKRDVTKEVRLERQLFHAQKHEAISTLAGGIAHDFNNILTGILGYSTLAMGLVEQDSKLDEYLKKIFKAGKRAADLVSQILTFSRQVEYSQKPMSLQPVVKESLKLLRGSLPSTIEIRQEIDQKCGMIVADVSQIHQVLMNLCTNAYHAMRQHGGVLEVKLEEVEVDHEFSLLHDDLKTGRYARLVVSDTGHGIEKEIIKQIFDPYFTTKDIGEGSGLGLATVHGVVEKIGGAVAVRSELGVGSSFEVYFPIHSPQTKFSSPIPEEEYFLPKVSGRVLFVDDEEIIVGMGEEMLTQLGCEVEVFMDSRAALERFEAGPGDFDLVITDQTMPHLTGFEMAQQLLAIRSDIPIILFTGFSEIVTEADAKKAGIREFILKPLEIHELAKIICRLLEEKSQSHA